MKEVNWKKGEVRSAAEVSPLPSPLTLRTSIDVSAGLLFRDGKLLIAQRHADAHLGGLWEFPGGKLECNETFESCLARELREELGIEIRVCELIETIEHDYPEKRVRLKFFRCQWLGHEPQALGCPAFAWVTREELANYAFPAGDARLLEHLRQADGLWLGHS